MKKYWIVAFIVVLLAILLPNAYWFFKEYRQAKETAPAETREGLPMISDENLISKVECKLNDFAIPIKVITKRRGIICATEANGTQAVGPELVLFHPYFVFEERPDSPKEDQPIFYYIGPTPLRRDIIGWVSSFNVQRWDTRVGGEYGYFAEELNPDESAPILPRLYVFEIDGEVVDWLNGKRVEPIAQADFKKIKKNLMPWPILETKTVTIDGRTYELNKIAFLGSYKEGAEIEEAPTPPSSSPPPSSAEKKEYARNIYEQARMVDIVFCIDATGSMMPYIDPVKVAVKAFVADMAKSKYTPNIAFGLVKYRDYIGGYSENVPFQAHSFQTDASKFGKVIDNIVADKGADDREAVLDAVSGSLQFEWRSPFSERIVILIGDNSGHDDSSDKQNPNNLTVDKIIALAKRDQTRTRIFSLMAPCHSDSTEVERHRLQFTKMAEKTGGEAFSLDQAKQVAPLVEKILQSGSDWSRTSTHTVEWLAEGKIKPPAKNTAEAITKVSDDKEICRVLTMMAKSGEVDWEKLAPGQISFSTGWVCTEAASTQIINKKVYISKPEIRFLRTNLSILVQGLNDPGFLEELRKTAHNPRVGISSFFTSSDSILRLDETLLDEGVPIGKHSILKFTYRELLMKPESWRQDIARKIESYYLPHIANQLRNTDAFPDPDELSFGWIWEIYLP